MSKKLQIFILIFCLILLIAVNYDFLDGKLQKFVMQSEEAVVERVIDGDTIVLEGGKHVRLLGINTPEKKEKYYEEAREFVNAILLNKTVSLEFGKEKVDLYNRTLAYVYLDGELFNLKLIENGLANFYFPLGKDAHFEDFKKAWGNCLIKNKNLCEKSEIQCVELKDLDVKEQKVSLKNACGRDINLNLWEIGDEGRKKLIFENFILKRDGEVNVIIGNGTNTSSKIYWERKDYVWTKTGDSLFLRDDKGKLILFYNY